MTNVVRYGGLVAGVFVLIATLQVSFLHDRPTVCSDSMVYIEGAKSLAAGKGYSIDGSPHTAWPPGYSAILAIPSAMFGTSITVFKLVNIAFGLTALLFIFLFLSNITDRSRALLLTFLTGVFFPWIYYTHAILSDIPFSFLASVFLYFGVRYCQKGRNIDLVIFTFACALMPLVRMAGIAVVPAWLAVVFVIRGDVKSWANGHNLSGLMGRVGILVAMCLPLVLWTARNYAICGSLSNISTGVTAEYMSSLSKIGIDTFDLSTKISINIRGYLHILAVPDQSGIARVSSLPSLVRVICVAVSVAVAAGWIRAIIKKESFFPAMAFACYGGMLVLHNWYDIRYLLPVIPLYFLYMQESIEALVAVLLKRICSMETETRVTAGRYTAILVLSLLLVANLAVSLVGSHAKRLRSHEYEGASQRSYEACRFMSRSQLPGNVLVASGGGFTGVWSGRKVTSLLPMVGPNGKLSTTVIPGKVVFLLADESTFVDYRRRYMDPILEANRDRIMEVFRLGETAVYQVKDCGDGSR